MEADLEEAASGGHVAVLDGRESEEQQYTEGEQEERQQQARQPLKGKMGGKYSGSCSLMSNSPSPRGGCVCPLAIESYGGGKAIPAMQCRLGCGWA